jgi:hypothetical protein
MCIKMPKPRPYDNINTMMMSAYNEAERYYYTAHTKRHERKVPSLDWDEAYFIAHARLWLVMLATWNHMNGSIDNEAYVEELNKAYNANFEDCLVAMYG